MNQKGFANIILIILVVVLAGALGYVTLVEKQVSNEQRQSNNSSAKPIESKTYRDERYHFEYKYPGDMTPEITQHVQAQEGATCRTEIYFRPYDAEGRLKLSNCIDHIFFKPQSSSVPDLEEFSNKFPGSSFQPLTLPNGLKALESTDSHTLLLQLPSAAFVSFYFAEPTIGALVKNSLHTF